MKLSKEELKKLALSLLMFVALLYCYFTFLLGPLGRAQVRHTAALAELTPKIEAATQQLEKTAKLEAAAPKASAMLEGIQAMIPEGAPVAWFPPRMAEHFKKRGIDKALTRLSTESTEKDLPGFRKLLWTIDLPRTEFVELGKAIADLENEEPLLQVLNVTVEASGDEAQYQHATLVVANLVKQ